LKNKNFYLTRLLKNESVLLQNIIHKIVILKQQKNIFVLKKYKDVR